MSTPEKQSRQIIDTLPVQGGSSFVIDSSRSDNHASWTEDRLWDAFAVTAPAK